MSNYGGGLLAGVAINGVPLGLIHPGKVFWVSNATAAAQLKGVRPGSDIAGTPGTFNRPFATVDYAIGRCTASRGDVIVVKPGHAETLSTAAAITSDVAGVAIVGLGTGDSRPTFTFDVAAATWSITAANLSFYNVVFVGSLLDPGVTTLLNIAGGADHLTFESVEMKDASATLTYITGMTLATGVDNLTINNSKFSAAGTELLSFIAGVAHDGFYVSNSSFYANGVQDTLTAILAATGNVTNTLIKDSYFRSFIDGALIIGFLGAANGGLITNCYFSSNDAADATTAGVVFAGGHCFECYFAGDADSYGIVGGGDAIYNNA